MDGAKVSSNPLALQFQLLALLYCTWSPTSPLLERILQPLEMKCEELEQMQTVVSWLNKEEQVLPVDGKTVSELYSLVS